MSQSFCPEVPVLWSFVGETPCAQYSGLYFRAAEAGQRYGYFCKLGFFFVFVLVKRDLLLGIYIWAFLILRESNITLSVSIVGAVP